MEPTQEKPNIAMRIGVIIGVIVILFVISIGIIKLVPKAVSSLANVSLSFSSLFSPKDKIDATLSPETIHSGDKTSLSFSYTNTKKQVGYYTLSYDCTSGAKLSYQSGNSNVVIDCTKPYPFSSPSGKIALTGTIPSTSNGVSVPITVAFTANGSSTISASDSVTLNITNAAGTATSTSTVSVTPTPKPTPTPTYPTPSTPSNVNGHADLTVRLTDIGIADPVTGNFVSTRNFTAGNTVVLKFEVINLGDKSSGTWGLQTVQPMQNLADTTKVSSGLRSLAPGESTGPITLGLSGIAYQGGTVTITVTPGYTASEVVTSNNTLQTIIPATIGNNSTGYYPDLAVQIISTGIVNRYNGQYVQTTNVHSTDRVRVRFTVKNIGGRDSGIWSLSANLPGATSGNFTSDNQASLRPGQLVDFNIDFDGLQNQNYGSYYYNNYSTVSITADPNNQVYESNENNNTASTNLTISY